jgi:hypothetical protein
MIRKSVLTASLFAGAALSLSTPAHATWWKHKHYCNCGHSAGGKSCGGNTTTSGGTTTSGNTTSGNTTSGNTTSGNTSGSTQVPEPGMLGLMGAGLAGLAIVRRKRARKA